MNKIANALEKAGYSEKSIKGAGLKKTTSRQENNSIPYKSESPALQEKSQNSNNDRGNKKKNQTSMAATSTAWNQRFLKAINDDIRVPEIFKSLRSKILHLGPEEEVPRTILVTSAMPREGKSFIAANLAFSIAKGLEEHALLVDCDLRRPSLASVFGLDNTRGITDYLRQEAELPQLIQKTSVNKLSIIPAGKPPANPAELLSSSQMKDLLEELAERYDDRLIILDSPPATMAAETAVLAGSVDKVLLVVRQKMSGRESIEKTVKTIGKDKIIGIVFNDQKANGVEEYISRRNHYYYYRPESD